MTSDEMMNEQEKGMTVVVVGLNRNRLQNIMSMVQEEQETCIEMTKVQFLSCLASIGSYYSEKEDDTRQQSSSLCHYLSNLQPLDGSPMTKFLDDDSVRASIQRVLLVGYEWSFKDDSTGGSASSPSPEQMISNYFQSHQIIDLTVKCVEPHLSYPTLQEEMNAFKSLTEEEKTKQAQEQTMGPGKMVKFILDNVRDALKQQSENINESTVADMDKNVSQEHGEGQSEALSVEQQEEESVPTPQLRPRIPPNDIDTSKTRYACRMCRTILLGEDHLLESSVSHPDTTNKKGPNFGKGKRQQVANKACQSFFCQETILDWLGDNNHQPGDGMTAMEGRLECPKCSHKIGHWNWSGAPCSCGKWVTPAIQIPHSKVDTLQPQSSSSMTTMTSVGSSNDLNLTSPVVVPNMIVPVVTPVLPSSKTGTTTTTPSVSE